MEMFIIFEIMGFFELYGVSRSFSIESKESQDLSNVPRALIERLTILTSLYVGRNTFIRGRHQMLLTSRLQ